MKIDNLLNYLEDNIKDMDRIDINTCDKAILAKAMYDAIMDLKANKKLTAFRKSDSSIDHHIERLINNGFYETYGTRMISISYIYIMKSYYNFKKEN